MDDNISKVELTSVLQKRFDQARADYRELHADPISESRARLLNRYHSRIRLLEALADDFEITLVGI